MVQVRPCLRALVSDPEWEEWVTEVKRKTRPRAAAARRTIRSKSVAALTTKLLAATKPIISLLRMADSNVPCTGKVYYMMSALHESLIDIGLDTDMEFAIEEIIAERWEFLHNDVYSAAYALDPEYLFAGHEFQKLQEVMDGLSAYCVKMLGEDKAIIAMNDYTTKYLRRLGSFGGTLAAKAAPQVPAHAWWGTYGHSAPELQGVAVKVLAQVPSASPCERNWSDFGYVHSKVRNRLKAERAEKLVYVYRNSREGAKHEGVFDEESVAWAYAADDE